MPRQQSNAFYGLASIVIAVIAGAWTIFHLVWNINNNTADDFWGQALLVLFIVGVILAFAQYFSERTALKATISPNDPFPEPTIAKFFFGSAGSAPMWFVLRMNVGAQWFLAGYSKLFGSESAGWASGKSLAGFVAVRFERGEWGESFRAGLVRQLPAVLGAAACGALRIPGQLGRAGGRTRGSVGCAYWHRRRLRRPDEYELPVVRRGKH